MKSYDYMLKRKNIKQKEYSQSKKTNVSIYTGVTEASPGRSPGREILRNSYRWLRRPKTLIRETSLPVKKMEIENVWSSMKTFYFRNENVILRVPFCFFLQLGMYFDKIVKESKEEDTKTWYETAGKRPSSCLLKISSHAGKKQQQQFVHF